MDSASGDIFCALITVVKFHGRKELHPKDTYGNHGKKKERKEKPSVSIQLVSFHPRVQKMQQSNTVSLKTATLTPVVWLQEKSWLKTCR